MREWHAPTIDTTRKAALWLLTQSSNACPAASTPANSNPSTHFCVADFSMAPMTNMTIVNTKATANSAAERARYTCVIRQSSLDVIMQIICLFHVNSLKNTNLYFREGAKNSCPAVTLPANSNSPTHFCVTDVLMTPGVNMTIVNTKATANSTAERATPVR